MSFPPGPSLYPLPPGTNEVQANWQPQYPVIQQPNKRLQFYTPQNPPFAGAVAYGQTFKAILAGWIPPDPGPTFHRNAQPYQPPVLTPPTSGPTPQRPPVRGARVPIESTIWAIPPDPMPITVRNKIPPNGPVPQNPPFAGAAKLIHADIFVSWIPPDPMPITVRNIVPPISGPAPTTPASQNYITNLFALFNDIVEGTNQTWCFFDLYTITLFNGGVLRYTTADFDVAAFGATYSSGSVRIDEDMSKVQAHWKVGLDVDTWTVVFMPRPIDPISGALFPDVVGSIPFIQAAQGGWFDNADFQVDRAYFTTTPTWPMPPAGAVPVGTKTIFAGKVAQIDCTDLVAVFTVNDYRDMMSISMPRHFFQGTCRHTLFDAGCNASGNMIQGSFSQPGAVGPGSTQSNIIPMSRSNLIPFSNTFSSWLDTNITTFGTGGQGPDGTNDAWIIQRTTTAASYIGDDTVTTSVPAGATVTFSIFAKPGIGGFLAMYLSNEDSDPYAVRACFELNGTISIAAHQQSNVLSNLSAGIENQPNGFFRCWVTATFPFMGKIRPYVSPRFSSGEIDGIDTASNSSVFLFGAQVEIAPSPTYYIGTASAPVSLPNMPSPGGSGTYALGNITMTSGLNATFSRTISTWDGTNMLLFAPFPFTINVGDTFVASAGCDLQRSTCLAFGNLINFGGFPYIPAPEVIA